MSKIQILLITVLSMTGLIFLYFFLYLFKFLESFRFHYQVTDNTATPTLITIPLINFTNFQAVVLKLFLCTWNWGKGGWRQGTDYRSTLGSR